MLLGKDVTASDILRALDLSALVAVDVAVGAGAADKTRDVALLVLKTREFQAGELA